MKRLERALDFTFGRVMIAYGGFLLGDVLSNIAVGRKQAVLVAIFAGLFIRGLFGREVE